MDYNQLINNIKETDIVLKQKALTAINQALTIRNWLTGFYIVEFEQKGEDRAKYGEKLLLNLATNLKQNGLKGYTLSNLKLYRQFYNCYPAISQSVISQLQLNVNEQNIISQSVISQLNKDEKLTSKNVGLEAEVLIQKLSYTHLIELMKISDNLKRAFYEIECISGNWSVRELQRQIGSLLFERTGLSSNKERLLEITNNKSVKYLPEDIIRDPYMLEFLGLKQSEIFLESKLEDLIIAHLQNFLLELGKGFCFEARQKRITIDNKHYYIDLVFYHKILKCNVIIELKSRKFEHSDASQLRVYLNYWKKYEMQTDDNPPVGILLCTDSDKELVEFATTGIDEQVFISKYMIELPSIEELTNFIHNKKDLIKIKK